MLDSNKLALLKADIIAQAFPGEWFAGEIADWYNQPADPAWYVWRSSVTGPEWRNAVIGGGGATQLDGLTASKRDSLLWALSDTLNPSVANVRAALDDFCGSQNTLKAAIAAVQKRTATRAEKLFSAGTGSSGSPATMGHEGTINYRDVEAAMVGHY